MILGRWAVVLFIGSTLLYSTLLYSPDRSVYVSNLRCCVVLWLKYEIVKGWRLEEAERG